MKLLEEAYHWQGQPYFIEYFDGDFTELSPITQVQALCRLPDGRYVIFEDIKGNFGLPGGSVESGETLAQTLARELKEEAAIEPIEFGPLLYLKILNPPDVEPHITYQARFWSTVKLLNQQVNDPAGKSVARHIVTETEMIKKLNWGNKLEVYLKTFKQLQSQN